ncbi:MAG: CtpF protein, partial [Alphaproteobacteria bacterium]|nr:CtpF protein [Alphaproteobacteria bacterium]
MVVDAFLLSEEAQARIGDALKDRNIAKFEGHVALGGVVEAVEYYTERPTPDILIVEFEGDGEGIKGGLETLAEVCDSGTRVVAVGAENDVALYRSLLRMGVSDYLTAPVTARQVFDVIHGLVSDPDAQPAGRVLAFVGSRGGVGSSTVAHNTAWSLSDSYDEDVGVVDLDLQYGT